MGDFVQLRDGSLLMSFTKDDIMAVKSMDQGKTWGEPFVLVPQPKPPARGHICHPSFLRLVNGQILLSYIYSTHPTTPYYGHNYYRRSDDEGETFIDLRHIRRDPEDDFGYQCVEFVSDDLVLVGYHVRDGIHVARIGLDWFYEETATQVSEARGLVAPGYDGEVAGQQS